MRNPITHSQLQCTGVTVESFMRSTQLVTGTHEGGLPDSEPLLADEGALKLTDGMVFPRHPHRSHNDFLFDDQSLSTALTSCTSTSTSSTSSLDTIVSPTFPRKKRVHFQLFECKTFLPSLQEPCIKLTEEEIVAMWWTPEERLSFRTECWKQIKRAKEQPEITEAFAFLYEACRLGSLFDQTSHKHGIQSRKHVHQNRLLRLDRTNPVLEKCIETVFSTPYRGLEVKMFGPFYRNRKRVIRKILKMQNSLPFHGRAEALASKSRSLTKRSQHLARVMAEADRCS